MVAGWGGGLDWECGMSRYELVYAGRIHNKALLWSTEVYTEYPVINRDGREHVCTYMCIPSHFPVLETQTTL